MGLKLSNNAISRLSSSLAVGGTSLSVLSGHGARFPTLGAGDYFPATLLRSSDGASEVVLVTARSSDTFTITRAQEGTTALSFSAGDMIELRATAGVFDEIRREATQAEAEAGTSTTFMRWSPQRIWQAIAAWWATRNVLAWTYTPTLTNVTNVSSSAAVPCQYMRVDTVVTVSGQVAIDPTATGDTELHMSIPIASNFTTAAQAGGTFCGVTSGVKDVGAIYADTANDRVVFRFTANNTANVAYPFTFTYRVL